MKAVGFGLLLAGWLLVIAALVLLKSPGSRGAFIAAGIAVELLGFGVAIRTNLHHRSEQNSH
jgi:hypothetical protein